MLSFNKKQRQVISSFFSNISVAWFIGAFITPQIAPEFDVLTMVRYLGNMVGAFILSLYIMNDE